MTFFINCLLLILAVFSYVYSPSEYDFYYSVLVVTLSSVVIIWFLKRKSSRGVLNFYTIFFFSFWLVNFFYPVILYPLDPQYFSVFTIDFNDDVITKSTALGWVAANSFICGALVKVKSPSNGTIKDFESHSHLPLTVLVFIFILLFLYSVGESFLLGSFDSQSPVSAYILQLLICCILLCSIVFFKGYKYQRWKIFFVLVVLVYLVMFLRVGDRGPALSVMVVSIVLYSQYVRKVSVYYIVPIAFVGLLLMHLVGEGRSHDVVLDDSSIISRGLEGFHFDVESYLNLTHSFVVNTWTLYFGVDYVDNNGLNYGVTAIKPVLAVFPFLLGVLSALLNFNLYTSAEFITQSVLGEEASWGLGTNLVVDVYMSFGLFGVICLFALFGFLVEKSRVNALLGNKIGASIVYFTLVSYAVYIPRTSLFMPLKFILWTYIIYSALRLLGVLVETNKVRKV